MKDYGDHCKDQQQVDQETRSVKDHEATNPCQDQDKRNNQKHMNLEREAFPLKAEMMAADTSCPPQNNLDGCRFIRIRTAGRSQAACASTLILLAT